jgi:hypothetical protein
MKMFSKGGGFCNSDFSLNSNFSPFIKNAPLGPMDRLTPIPNWELGSEPRNDTGQENYPEIIIMNYGEIIFSSEE